MNKSVPSQPSAKLSALFYQSSIPIAFVSASDLIFEEANDSMLAILGKSNPIIGTSLLNRPSSIKKILVPETLLEVIQTGIEKRIDGVQLPGNPEEKYFDFVFSPSRDADGSITGISIVAIESTAKKPDWKSAEENELRFRNLVLEADVATGIYVGEDMRIEIANEAMIKLWGKDSRAIGKTIREALPELDGQPFHDLLSEVYRTGITYKATEDRVDLVVDGKLQTFYFNFTYKALRTSSGEIYGILNMAVDVTEQVLARQRALDSEKKFHNMIMQAPVAICVFKGEDMVFEVVNNSFFEIINRGPEVLGKPLLTALPELKGQAADVLYEVYRTGKPFYGFELPATFRRDGELKTGYYNFSYTPLYEEGKIVGVLDVASEVTELVLAKQKAQDSEAKFRNLITQAPVGMAVLQGADFEIEIANAETLEIWRRSESVIGQRIEDAFPELVAQGVLDILQKVYKSGEPFFGNEYPVQISDGQDLATQYINFVYHPIFENGKVSSLLSLGYNVTDLVTSRKIAEESERMLIEQADSMPQQVWTANADGNLVFVNKVTCEYFGKSESEICETGWLPLIHPDDVANFLSQWKESDATGQHYEVEFRLKNKDDQYRSFLGRAVPVRNADGDIIRWIGTNTDIDELKMLQRQKDDFLGIASHELKTPVTTLKAYTQVLERMLKKEEDKQKAGFVSKMNAQLNRLQALISDLLDVTKIQRGKLDFNDDFFDFDELVKDVIDELQYSAKHQLQLSLTPAGKIYADRDRIRQVITNFVTNATKYSPKADRVLISSEPDGDHVKFCVQDFGIGIPDDKKNKVFEQFYRVKGVTEYTFPGLGLGLYISAEIIKRENGRIWMSSAVGKGSTFCFSLPRQKKQEL